MSNILSPWYSVWSKSTIRQHIGHFAIWYTLSSRKSVRRKLTYVSFNQCSIRLFMLQLVSSMGMALPKVDCPSWSGGWWSLKSKKQYCKILNYQDIRCTHSIYFSGTIYLYPKNLYRRINEKYKRLVYGLFPLYAGSDDCTFTPGHWHQFWFDLIWFISFVIGILITK